MHIFYSVYNMNNLLKGFRVNSVTLVNVLDLVDLDLDIYT